MGSLSRACEYVAVEVGDVVVVVVVVVVVLEVQGAWAWGCCGCAWIYCVDVRGCAPVFGCWCRCLGVGAGVRVWVRVCGCGCASAGAGAGVGRPPPPAAPSPLLHVRAEVVAITGSVAHARGASLDMQRLDNRRLGEVLPHRLGPAARLQHRHITQHSHITATAQP